MILPIEDLLGKLPQKLSHKIPHREVNFGCRNHLLFRSFVSDQPMANSTKAVIGYEPQNTPVIMKFGFAHTHRLAHYQLDSLVRHFSSNAKVEGLNPTWVICLGFFSQSSGIYRVYRAYKHRCNDPLARAWITHVDIDHQNGASDDDIKWIGSTWVKTKINILYPWFKFPYDTHGWVATFPWISWFPPFLFSVLPFNTEEYYTKSLKFWNFLFLGEVTVACLHNWSEN